jgi:hypothetical protein
VILSAVVPMEAFLILKATCGTRDCCRYTGCAGRIELLHHHRLWISGLGEEIMPAMNGAVFAVGPKNLRFASLPHRSNHW